MLGSNDIGRHPALPNPVRFRWNLGAVAFSSARCQSSDPIASDTRTIAKSAQEIINKWRDTFGG
jgi:hypothetical protein